MSTVQTDEQSLPDKSTILTVCLILVALFVNSIGTLVFSNLNIGPSSYFWISLLCFSIGGLVAQPCLLAVWATLSPQTMQRRTLCSFGVLLFLTGIYLLVLLAADQFAGEPIGALVFFGIAIGLYFLAMIPVFAFRLKSRHALSSQKSDIDTDQSIQFGIRHIFALTTAVALLVPIAQYVFKNVGPSRDMPWLEISVFIVLHSLLVWGAFLFTVACVFATSRVRYYICLAFYLVVAPVIVVALLSLYFLTFRPMDTQSCVNGVAFAIGFSTVMIAVLQMYYSIGYRLRSVNG